jgi:hypothetical protein
VPRFVAVHTGFHRNGNFLRSDGIPLHHLAVTAPAFDLSMSRVAENHVVFNDVNLRLRENCVLFHRAMAVYALRHGWERSALAFLDCGVAIAALDLERRVFLMAELDRLRGKRKRGYGNEKATSESE